MKINILSCLLVITIIGISCKSKKESAATAEKNTQQLVGANQGAVSHQYRKDGCATVVIIKGESEDITLIPVPQLPKEIDVDGMNILFDYTTLRMPQPAGCNKGIPAELTNVSKK